jgi:hypothetical protein
VCGMRTELERPEIKCTSVSGQSFQHLFVSPFPDIYRTPPAFVDIPLGGIPSRVACQFIGLDWSIRRSAG